MRKKQPKTLPPLPSSVPPERISHTTIIRDDEAVTSSRGVILRESSPPRGEEASARALDRLLVAVVELPYERGEDAVVDALLDALQTALPTYAVGACFAGTGRQRVHRRMPLGEAAPQGVDPARLFPHRAKERVVDIPGIEGSTLHVASDELSLDDDRSAIMHLATRAAHALGRAVLHARAHARAVATKRDLDALEAHATQADKLASFGQIAASLVHELNNPLTSIVAYTDLLIKKSLADAPSRAPRVLEQEDVDRLSRISESANRMLRFTRDLVSYARPSSEVAVPVVLHGVIDQALAFCEHVLAEAGARVERRYGAEVLTVRGRPEQLTQVFVNLVTNACHAMTIGGVIVVSTRLLSDPKRVEVVVEDDGHGIAREHLPQVFAPFFTTKRDGRGTGLGLSIVKTIIDHHGGSIRVESNTEGLRGTRFTLELPLGR